MEAERQRIRRMIEAAFKDVRRPADRDIVPSEGDEDDRLREAFLGTHWEDWVSRPPADLERYAEIMVHFGREALRFYLPAFLIARLRDFEDTWDLGNVLVCLFKEPRKKLPMVGEDTRARIASFNEVQREALVEFFRYERDKAVGLGLNSRTFDGVIAALSRPSGD